MSGRVNITGVSSPHTAGNRAGRVLWAVVYAVFFRTSPRPFHRWRAMLLKLFGANIRWTSRVYPRCRVWAPWKLTMGVSATLGDDVDCYNVGGVTIGDQAVVSQYSYLCGATHDFEKARRPLVAMPIVIGSQCWIAADVFVGPGVTIGEGTVVGARSSVFGDLPAWKICYGTPAKAVKDRIIAPE